MTELRYRADLGHASGGRFELRTKSGRRSSVTRLQRSGAERLSCMSTSPDFSLTRGRLPRGMQRAAFALFACGYAFLPASGFRDDGLVSFAQLLTGLPLYQALVWAPALTIAWGVSEATGGRTDHGMTYAVTSSCLVACQVYLLVALAVRGMRRRRADDGRHA